MYPYKLYGHAPPLYVPKEPLDPFHLCNIMQIGSSLKINTLENTHTEHSKHSATFPKLLSRMKAI